jgi:hypothetical protein
MVGTIRFLFEFYACNLAKLNNQCSQCSVSTSYLQSILLSHKISYAVNMKYNRASENWEYLWFFVSLCGFRLGLNFTEMDQKLKFRRESRDENESKRGKRGVRQKLKYYVSFQARTSGVTTGTGMPDKDPGPGPTLMHIFRIQSQFQSREFCNPWIYWLRIPISDQFLV